MVPSANAIKPANGPKPNNFTAKIARIISGKVLEAAIMPLQNKYTQAGAKLRAAPRPIGIDKVDEYVVRGQYSNGWIDGKPVLGYLEEEGAEKISSNNETFVAIKVEIDNWRWAGVPFYMRTGKRMNAKHTEIVIVYKESSHSIFSGRKEDSSNKLVIRLQPNEGIELEMVSKKHSLRERLSTEKRVLNLDFNEFNSTSVSSGMLFVAIESNNQKVIRKCIILKN